MINGVWVSLAAISLTVIACQRPEEMRGLSRGIGSSTGRGAVNGGLLGTEPIDTSSAENEKIDTSKPQDAGCSEQKALPTLDFEGIKSGTIAGDEFWKSHGIKFSKPQRVVRTSRLGDPQLPIEERALLCALCKGSPAWNRLVDKEAEDIVGRNVLASAEPKNDVQAIDIVFSDLVKTGSFDLIDDDGSEKWTVIFFNSEGKEIVKNDLLSFRGYSIAKTRNGRPLHVEFDRPSKDVAAMRLVGAKNQDSLALHLIISKSMFAQRTSNLHRLLNDTYVINNVRKAVFHNGRRD